MADIFHGLEIGAHAVCESRHVHKFRHENNFLYFRCNNHTFIIFLLNNFITEKEELTLVLYLKSVFGIVVFLIRFEFWVFELICYARIEKDVIDFVNALRAIEGNDRKANKELIGDLLVIFTLLSIFLNFLPN